MLFAGCYFDCPACDDETFDGPRNMGDSVFDMPGRDPQLVEFHQPGAIIRKERARGELPVARRQDGRVSRPENELGDC